MIKTLHNIWNIKQVEGDEFTGYESVYDQLDAFDKAQYDADTSGKAIVDPVAIKETLDELSLALQIADKLNPNNISSQKLNSYLAFA